MIKNILILMAAGLFCLAACNNALEIKEITQPEDPNAPVQLITETISARVGDGATKATIDGSSGTFSWTEGKDKIAVHTTGGYVLSTVASASGATTDFTVSYSGSRDCFAVYPHTLVYNESTSSFIAECVETYGTDNNKTIKVCLPSTYALGDIQDDNTICPMIATNTPGSGWSFIQLCGLLRLTIDGIPAGTKSLKVDFNGIPVSGIYRVHGSPLTSTPSKPDSLQWDLHNDEYTDYYSVGIGGSYYDHFYEDIITITGITNQDPVTVNIPLPTSPNLNVERYKYRELIIYACDENGKPLKAAVKTLSLYTANRAKGKKVSATLSSELFSVADGKYALIAPSNLKATTTDSWSTWTFSFMENPWDIVETNLGADTCCTANYKTQSAASLFSFTSSGLSDDHQHPNSTNPSLDVFRAYRHAEYDLDRFVASVGSSSNYYRYADWGCNIISNDGFNRQGCGWITPSNAEWTYLLNTRSGYRYAKASIHSRNGLIIFPDNFNPTAVGVTISNENTANASFTSYSNDDWTKMANAGCVFLPVAGQRTGSTEKPNITLSTPNEGYYWSRTVYQSSSQKQQSYCVHFTDSEVNPEYHNFKRYGASVRLIFPVNYNFIN